jgi:hypothetical protein
MLTIVALACVVSSIAQGVLTDVHITATATAALITSPPPVLPRSVSAMGQTWGYVSGDSSELPKESPLQSRPD